MAHQKLHICFQFPAMIPETKSGLALEDQIGTKRAPTLLRRPALPFSTIIFSFTGKEHV